MANQKTTQLEQLTSITDGDLFYGVDIESTTSKKVEAQTVKNYVLGGRDLQDYVKNTDYASATKGGVVKYGNSYGTTILANGVLGGITRDYDQYVSGSDYTLIGKGTLENVIKGKKLADEDFVENNDNEIKKDVEKNSQKIFSTSNELYRIKDDILETGTASDSYVTLTDSTMAEYQELGIEGVCEQETTQGINIIGPGTKQYPVDLKIGDKITIKNISDKTRVLNLFTNLGDDTRNDYWTINSNSIKVITLAHDTKALAINLEYTLGSIYGFIGEYNESNIPKYEKYTNLQASPNPEFPQPISTIENELEVTSRGKNEFDKNNATVKNYILKDDNGNEATAETSGYTTSYTKVSPNENYVISGSLCASNMNMRIYLYDVDKNWIRRTVAIKGTEVPYKFTTPANCHYIQFQYQVSAFDINTIQIEKNSTASEYEDYISSKITANLGDEFVGKLDDTAKDTFKVKYNEEDGEYHLILNKVIAKKTLVGTESWTTNGLGTNSFSYRLTMQGRVSKSLCISSHYTFGKIDDTTTNVGIYIMNTTTTASQIRLRHSSELSLAEFKNWLSNNNVDVYYPIANPYEVDLGVVDMPITYDKITNLFTDSDLLPTINAKYYRTFEDTIKNLQVNDGTLKNELSDLQRRVSALEASRASLMSFESEEEA